MTDEKKKFRVALVKAGKINASGNVYPKEVLEQMVADAQKRLKARSLVGYAGEDRRLGNITHVVTGFEFKGETLEADVEVLATPMGKTIRPMVELMADPKNDVPFRFGLRGHGKTVEKDGVREVTDFTLESVDLIVGPPSEPKK